METVALIVSMFTVIISWQMAMVEPIRTLKLTGSKLLFADIEDIINKSVKLQMIGELIIRYKVV